MHVPYNPLQRTEAIRHEETRDERQGMVAMTVPATFLRVLEDLARLNHWWWKNPKGNEDYPPEGTYWWREPNFAGFRSAEDAPILQDVIWKVMNQCDDRLDGERDHDQPFLRLYNHYTRWAREAGAAETRAHIVAVELLLAYPGKRKEYIDGYYVHPQWLPLSREDFNKRVPERPETIQIDNEPVTIRFKRLLEDYDDDPESEESVDGEVVGDVSRDPGVLLCEAIENEPATQKATAVIAAQRQWFKDNGDFWQDLYDAAFSKLSWLQKEQIRKYGPWDRIYGQDDDLWGWYPDNVGHASRASKQARLKKTTSSQQLADKDTRHLKSQAQRGLLEKMAKQAGFVSINDMAHAIVAHPKNELALSMLRWRIGQTTWDATVDQPSYPLAFSRDLIRHACEQRLYVESSAAQGTSPAAR